MRVLIFTFLTFLLAFVHAQTETVEDPDTGNTVVEVVTTNRLGVFTTSTISTILAATATATTATTTQQQGGGVVGVPGTTNTVDPNGPTPYTYTTVVDGITTAVEATFIPSFTTALGTPAPATGTILDYSQWLSEFGSSTTAANSASRVSLSSHGLSGTAMLTVVTAMGLGWIVVLS
ncbi:hypothetical protein EV361DRAFT_54361 [Lentinula raphanica]|uniref:Uncharacterized protein n=1 Tax=Lentinula raphanica TaxID=153919 RepID=A0AA38UKM6_9AGAR|nr:hypothetical protein C8R42DRAFT_208212 [Lentinula raphanica]KAJ3829907.1 hypothetical protein F5880DRAFT_1519300 [Lentinula raphanica]KAJ3844754.1 hypothetical protein F5878DRAFT_601115 [Lentinula raphanica]KAJ3973495.1 hypothetical protein EV361DRAFT_54361 [Lentinula raphanica]